MSGWKKVKIGSLCGSIVPGRNKPKIFEGDIPWINTPDITSRYIPSSLHDLCVSREELENCGGKTVPAGAVIMACVGDLGLVAIATREIVINQQLHAFVCPENVCNEYIAYALEMQKAQMHRLASMTTIPYLNKSNCEGLIVPSPPYPKQKAIAGTLSIWDAAIEKTEALIEAKERQFRWLQNHLMDLKFRSYSKRLCEFSGIVQHKKIKEVGELKPLTVKLHCKGIEANERDMQITLSDKGRPYYQRFTGDFLIGRQNFHNGGFGIVPERLNGYIASNAISTLDIDKAKLDPDYLFYFFSRKDYYLRIGNIMDGTGQKEISDKQIMKLPVSIPSLERQQEVVMTLDAARQEIGLLKKLAEQYRTQKRGLMQKLLPGKWDVANG